MPDGFGNSSVDADTVRRQGVAVIKGVVRRCSVCWEVWPEYRFDLRGNRVQVGYELLFLGTASRSDEIPTPNAPACLDVFKVLQSIAEWAVNGHESSTFLRVESFDQAVRSSPTRDFRKDVTLTVRVMPRDGVCGPVTAGVTRVVHDIQERLRRAGINEGRFRVPG